MCFRNISLQQFGRLMPSFPIGMRGRFLYWACLCDCGTTAVLDIYKLCSGHTRSCGCLASETRAMLNRSDVNRKAASAHMTKLHSDLEFKPAFKHGHSKGVLWRNHHQSRTYSSWANMIDRCTRPEHNRWSHYGGANPPVTICDRWLGEHGFENFLADMGERPENTSLGRFGDIGNYEPENCEWQTPRQQGAEKRMHHQLQFVAA